MTHCLKPDEVWASVAIPADDYARAVDRLDQPSQDNPALLRILGYKHAARQADLDQSINAPCLSEASDDTR